MSQLDKIPTIEEATGFSLKTYLSDRFPTAKKYLSLPEYYRFRALADAIGATRSGPGLGTSLPAGAHL